MPFEILEHFSNELRNKTVLDIGCSRGDLLIYLRDLLNCRVRGIEWHEDRAEVARGKGLDVVTGDAAKLDLPVSDVYLLWIEKPDVEIRVAKKIENGTVMIFYNTESYINCDNPECVCVHMPNISEKFNTLQRSLDSENIAYVTEEICYDEGQACRQKGLITAIIIDLQGSSK